MDVLVFEIDNLRFALPARDTVEILRAVFIRPLPAPVEAVEGLVNLRGRVVPVIDVRALWGLPARALDASEHLVIAQAGERLIALRVDRAVDLVSLAPAQLATPAELHEATGAGESAMSGIAKLPDGLLLIHTPDALLHQAGPSALAAAGGAR